MTVSMCSSLWPLQSGRMSQKREECCCRGPGQSHIFTGLALSWIEFDSLCYKTEYLPSGHLTICTYSDPFGLDPEVLLRSRVSKHMLPDRQQVVLLISGLRVPSSFQQEHLHVLRRHRTLLCDFPTAAHETFSYCKFYSNSSSTYS